MLVALTLLPSFAAAAVSAGLAPSAAFSPLPEAAAQGTAPAASPEVRPTFLPAPSETLVSAATPQEAVLKAAAAEGIHPANDVPTWDEIMAESRGPTPLADTDNNDINLARWLNGSSSWTGESVNGAASGPFGRVDVDWWKFPMVNLTFSAADVMEFDIAKQSGEHLWAVVYAFPTFDPDNTDGTVDAGHVVSYNYLNISQGWSVNTHVKVTGFEDTLYFLYIYSPRRNGCCTVNYTIGNVSDYTVTGDSSIDENSNRTNADPFNPSAMPANQQVVQNSDYVDVFDLSPNVPLTPSMGDYSRVSITVQFSSGGTGWSEFWNTTQTPSVVSGGDTLSYATLWLLYPDRFNNWHIFQNSSITGNSVSITTLVNGTPLYVAVTVTSLIDIPGIYPTSSVPGSMRFNFTAFSHFDDLAPRAVGLVPDAAMDEDSPASGTDILDLAPFFTDDHDLGALWFDLQYNQQPARLFVNFTGTVLQLRTVANYYGTVMLQIRARDRGLDGIARTADDHATPSNYFDIVVRPANDPPVIATVGGAANTGAEIAFSVAQGATLTIDLTVVDPDGVEANTFAIGSLPTFAVFYPSNGSVTFQPGNTDVGLYHFTETVSDPALATGTASFSLTVTNVNDNPRFVEVGGVAMPGTLVFLATEDQPFTLVLRVSDPDWDIGVQDRLIFSSDKPFIAFTPDALDGRVNTTRFTPSNAQVGTIVVVFTVTDGAAGTVDDSISVSVVVQNANDAPRLTKVGTVTQDITVDASKSVNLTGVDGATQGRAFRMTVRAVDDDVSAGWADSLTFTTDQGAKFLVTANPDFVSAEITFTPNQTDAARGYILVHIRVTDAGVPSFQDEVAMRIDIANVNDPPVFVPVFSLNLTEGEAFVFVFDATDPDGDLVTFLSDSPLLPVDSTTGSIEVLPTNDMIDGANMQFDMTVTARDNHAGVATMLVHVFIRNVNQAPSGVQILSPTDLSSWGAGEGVTFQGAGTDIDTGDADALVFRWFADEVELGSGRIFVKGIENPNTGAKVVTIRLQVVDPHGASTNLTRSVTVNGTPAPPKSPGFDGPLVALALVGAAVVLAAGRQARSGRQK